VLVVAGVMFFGLAYFLGGRDGHGPWFQFACAPTMVSFLVAEYWMGRVTTTTPPPVAERLVLVGVVVWTLTLGILLALGRPWVPMVVLFALPFAARRLVRRLFR
jgi:hypothetical protein